MKDTSDSPILFLLGGYDLEMISIRALLMSNGYVEVLGPDEFVYKAFADKKLAWGAALSAYDEFLYYSGAIYGIELIEDRLLPQHYIRIDHHNAYAHLPSAIEQVADVLRVTLSRQQQLVAANDKGYIPAMKAMQASEAEIQEIRRKDRAAQGVSGHDEVLAEQSVKSQLRYENGIAIIPSLTDKFSPVTDRMFGKAEQLIVYTDTKLVYYGKRISKLAMHFNDLISSGKAYHGGGESGYFGLAEGEFNKKKIKEFIVGIIKTVNE